jgi:hypothetical protein
MDWYLLLLFAHILAGIGLLSALCVEAVGFLGMRRSVTGNQGHSWLVVQRNAVRFETIAMATAVVAGIWMMAARWGPEAWTVTALAAIVGMAALTATVTRRGLKRLATGRTDGDNASDVAVAMKRRLGRSLWIRIGIGIGILALMTSKPQGPASAGILLAAIVGGVVGAEL